jgi:hypothetical protein
MIREDESERLNIRSKLIEDSIFAYHEHDAYSKSLFKRRRRDSDSNNIYDLSSSFFLTRLFSMIISKRSAHDSEDTHVENTQAKITHIRSTHVRNTHVIDTHVIDTHVIDTHVEMNSLVSSSHILVLREKVVATKTKTRARNALRWFSEKATLKSRIIAINTSIWDLLRDSSLISLRSHESFENENSCLKSLIVRYSIINIDHFKSILKEDFKSMNVIKLCTKYEKILTKFKYIKMSDILKMKIYKNDVKKFDIKKITHLIRCFLIYIQIILIFVDSLSRERLNSSFMFYVNKFFFFSIIYIWELVRSWHFVVHAFWIVQNVQDLVL